MKDKLYPFRFELFFISMLLILFGNIVLPIPFYNTALSPLFFLINLLAGILLISKNKKVFYFFTSLFLLAIGFFIVRNVFGIDTETNIFAQSAIYFLFYGFVCYEIIQQVWRAQLVNKNVIIGLMSGYISLGLLAFFMFLAIETAAPGSFRGIQQIGTSGEGIIDGIVYYSYITLLTIGYGDIVPVTSLARKASILTGLMGQFYMVIITAIVVGKFINQLNQNSGGQTSE
ncbi:potassium channel family protein [Flavobacteriaceae bacterium D16]|nr:potassium channel family protein [Flavobacteriaceae bacterium D16]